MSVQVDWDEAALAARERALRRQPARPMSRVGSEEVGLTRMEGWKEEPSCEKSTHLPTSHRSRTRAWLRLGAASGDDLAHGSTSDA